MRAVEERLVVDSLVHRYEIDGAETSTGWRVPEGTFSICSFWYIECLSRSGDLLKARFLFEKMLGYANHVGLYAEEIGPSGEQLGNFPQAFTHLALISAAYDLDRRLSRGRVSAPSSPPASGSTRRSPSRSASRPSGSRRFQWVESSRRPDQSRSLPR